MKISVYIPSYNQRAFLREAIESVLAQTRPPCQIIVVDDASADGSQDLIADYVRRRPDLFTAIYHPRNLGIAQVRIHALRAVRGTHVSYVDGDDVFLPEKLEKEAAALATHPEAKLSFSNNLYVSEDGAQALWTWIDQEKPAQGHVFLRTFAREFPHRSLFRMELVEYEAWKRIGFHDPRLRLYEDFDMRIRLTQTLPVVYCDEVLSKIRRHGSGLSHARLSLHYEALDYLYRKNLPLLSSVDPARRRHVLHRFGEWIHPIAASAAREAWREGRPIPAIRIWLRGWLYRMGVAT